jgi:oxygen-independent coproporphyrinogen-3 oxidase
LSIGIQSFSDIDLKQLGRRHDAAQAVNVVNLAHNAGFENLSIDLIYGLPYSSSDIWIANLEKAFDLPVKHLSCYHLIYEEGTPLSKRVALGKVTPVSEDLSVEQFQILQEFSAQNGFIHYEISNLAKEGFFSRHNSSYWKQLPYLGLGPSAHSYNGISRDWNPRSIGFWKDSIENETPAVEMEILSARDKLNDYFITALRTIWGVNIDFVAQNFGEDKATKFKQTAEKYMKQGVIEQRVGVFRILPKHFITSDGIISDFLEI